MKTLKSKILISSLLIGGIFTNVLAYSTEGDTETTYTGQSSSVRTSGTIGSTLTDINKEDSTSAENRFKMPSISIFSGKVILDSETGSAKVLNQFGTTPHKYDADVKAGILSYSKDISNKLSAGFIFPYRKVKVNDGQDTTLDTYTLVPYLRIKNTSSNGKFINNLNLFLVLGYNKFKSKWISATNKTATLAYYEIGAGALYNPILKIRDNLRWSLSMQLAIDRYLTNYAMIDNTWDDETFKKSVSRSGKSTYIGNIGTSFIYTPIPNLDITIGFLRVQKISKAEWEAAARNDYYYIKANYRWNRFRFGLGFKQLDGVNGYEEYTYMASISYDFF